MLRHVMLSLIEQEIARLDGMLEHYAGRINRGTADLEDETCFALYNELRNDLKAKWHKCREAILLEERAAEQAIDLARGK